MTRISDNFFTVQVGLLRTAASKLHQWAMQYGSEEQAALTLALVEHVVKTIAQLKGEDDNVEP